MAIITLKGNAINTCGNLPALNSVARDFKLTRSDLSDVSLKDYKGKRKLLNIVPSLDTGICAASARKFNIEAGNMLNSVMLTISCDLPFAQNRFCEAEGIKNVVSLSELRNRNFGEDYGVRIVDGPLAGLMSRAIVVLDEKDRVVYTEQVCEIAQEPNYEKALAALKG